MPVTLFVAVAKRLVECVPNFSEGRNAAIVDAIADAVESGGGIVLDRTLDADHNRSVITFVASPERAADAALAAVSQAVACIDLRRHTGAHPRVGAADVVPFVPLDGVSMEECVAIARQTAARIWNQLGVPCYLYEEAALRPGRRNLADIRRGQFETLIKDAAADSARHPDVGGPALHPSAGASVVGARKFLIAFNVNLLSQDLAAARQIARTVRASSGGLECVKAMGVWLAGRNQAQVSMNLTDFERTPVDRAFAAVREEAERREIEVASSEIVGMVPRRAWKPEFAARLQVENFSPRLILENRIESEPRL